MGLIDQITKQPEGEAPKHDFTAIKELFDISYRMVYSICIRISADINYSNSLVNKIYAYAYFNLSNLRPDSDKLVWIKKSTIDTLVEEYKKGRLSISDSNQSIITVKSIKFTKQQYKLEKSLSTLRAEDRLVYILSERLNIPVDDIANLLRKQKEEINTILINTKNSLISTGVTDFVSEKNNEKHYEALKQLTLTLPETIEPDTNLWESTFRRINKKIRNFDETKENYDLPISEKADKSSQKVRSSHRINITNTKQLIYLILFLILLSGGYYFYNFIFSEREPWNLTIFDSGKINGKAVSGNAKLIIGDRFENGKEETKISIPHFGHLVVSPNSILERHSPGETQLTIKLISGSVLYESFQSLKQILIEAAGVKIQNYYLGSSALITKYDERNAGVNVNAGAMELNIKNSFIVIPENYIGGGVRNNKLLLPFSKKATLEYEDDIILFNDDNNNNNAVSNIIKNSTKEDAYTLWNLLLLCNNEIRNSVYEKLELFVSLPEGITKDKILQKDKKSMLRWFDTIEDIYYE